MNIKYFVANITPRCIKDIRKRVLATTFPIVKKPNEIFDEVYKIKDVTWENTYYPECIGHCKEQHLEVFHLAQYIYKINNAIVCCDSDVVLTNKGAYWDKFNDEEFVSWAIPADGNVLFYDHNNIGIRRKKQIEHIRGKVLSLIGLWAEHWGHCMYQFLPKLFTAGEAGLLNDKIILLMSAGEDGTIRQIISDYLANFPNVEIKYANKNIEYECEEMYFMPSQGSNFNDHHFRLDYPFMIAANAIKMVDKYVVKPNIEKIRDNTCKHEKLFLGRGSFRTLTNYDEVHDYFASIGFIDVDGASLTLEEKADLFYHAREIVCLYGSALLNAMFCNKANCMVLINYKMSTDTSLYLQIRDYVATCVNVTGMDESSDYHSNYYISLEKIKKIYNERIKTD